MSRGVSLAVAGSLQAALVHGVLVIGMSCYCGVPAAVAEPLHLELVDSKRIWEAAPHCAFTDLIRWRETWYCGFREGLGHAGDQGQLRLIESHDGENWNSAATIGHDSFDFRDAAISVTPDGRLMVLAGSQHEVGGQRSTGSFVAFSKDGKSFTAPQRVSPQGRWLWRVTWRGGLGYGVAYAAYADYPNTTLVSTTNGLDYKVVLPVMLSKDHGRPTEARLRFSQDGTAYCFQRRDGDPSSALLGTARPPYKSWTWKDLGRRVGGPNMIQLPSGHWIGCSRLTGPEGARTEVFSLDVDAGVMTQLVTLPSGGDTSYPGMVWHNGLVWISYYSSHEEKTSIYLARLKPHYQ